MGHSEFCDVIVAQSGCGDSYPMQCSHQHCASEDELEQDGGSIDRSATGSS